MYNEFSKIINISNNIVFFGGAGVSTESGIPDFRSVDGLYNQKYEYPPETILSSIFFHEHTEKFYEFYRDKILINNAEPNVTHKALARLEEIGKLKAVITQNIDGLHQAAGSCKVFELHGSIERNFCIECGKAYNKAYIINCKGVPLCNCGGIIKPDVVLYGEALDDKILENSISAIKNADVLIIGGTSLAVYPAAGLIRYYKGDKLILINKSQTPFDSYANLVIHDSLGKVFSFM